MLPSGNPGKRNSGQVVHDLGKDRGFILDLLPAPHTPVTWKLTVPLGWTLKSAKQFIFKFLRPRGRHSFLVRHSVMSEVDAILSSN